MKSCAHLIFLLLVVRSYGFFSLGRLQSYQRHNVFVKMCDVASCDLSTEGTINCDKPTTESVWTVFGNIAAKTGATNLGQGFPDWCPPAFVMQV